MSHPVTLEPISKRQHAKQLREQELLGLAQQILQQEGFAGLTMDRLTALSSVSKGTIYNHFCSKEDLFTALSVDSLQRQLRLFQRAQLIPGHSREQALALHLAYHRFSMMEPTLFLCLLTATTPAVVEKSSPARLALRQQLEMQLATICEQLIAQAIAQGDLELPPGQHADALAFIQWAQAFGSNALLKPTQQLGLFSQLLPQPTLLLGINLLLDGLNWKPLSRDWDYQASWQRMMALFAIESSAAISTIELMEQDKVMG
jgi:AcrR family transcriptional regulator